jgi:hypothetical protein
MDMMEIVPPTHRIVIIGPFGKAQGFPGITAVSGAIGQVDTFDGTGIGLLPSKY